MAFEWRADEKIKKNLTCLLDSLVVAQLSVSWFVKNAQGKTHVWLQNNDLPDVVVEACVSSSVTAQAAASVHPLELSRLQKAATSPWRCSVSRPSFLLASLPWDVVVVNVSVVVEAQLHRSLPLWRGTLRSFLRNRTLRRHDRIRPVVWSLDEGQVSFSLQCYRGDDVGGDWGMVGSHTAIVFQRERHKKNKESNLECGSFWNVVESKKLRRGRVILLECGACEPWDVEMHLRNRLVGLSVVTVTTKELMGGDGNVHGDFLGTHSEGASLGSTDILRAPLDVLILMGLDEHFALEDELHQIGDQLRLLESRMRQRHPNLCVVGLCSRLSQVHERAASLFSETMLCRWIRQDGMWSKVNVKALEDAVVGQPDAVAAVAALLRGEVDGAVMLLGPPGVGKTVLCDAACQAMGEDKCKRVSISSIISAYIGETEKAMERLFRDASESAPTLIVIDDADVLMGSSNASSKGLSAHFSHLLDQSRGKGVAVLLTAKHSGRVDSSLLQGGRLGKVVHLRITPSHNDRLLVLRRLLVSASDDIVSRAAESTEGMMLSDVARVAHLAALECVANQCDKIQWHHVEIAIQRSSHFLIQ